MSKKTLLPQSRRHIWVYDEDWDYISSRFGEELGVSKALRNMVHQYVVNLKAKEAQAIDLAPQAPKEGAVQ